MHNTGTWTVELWLNSTSQFRCLFIPYISFKSHRTKYSGSVWYVWIDRSSLLISKAASVKRPWGHPLQKHLFYWVTLFAFHLLEQTKRRQRREAVSSDRVSMTSHFDSSRGCVVVCVAGARLSIFSSPPGVLWTVVAVTSLSGGEGTPLQLFVHL